MNFQEMADKKKVDYLFTKGRAYYGNGEALCFDCWSAGKVLENVFEGYGLDALNHAQVSLLLEAADAHRREKNHNRVKVFVFERE